MTLILTYITPDGLVQASDRLVSRASLPYDASSNKSVIFLGRDGLVTVAYTGLAFLENRPTDTWIAETLSGRITEYVVANRPALQLISGPIEGWPTITQALHRLSQRMQEVFSSMPASRRPELHSVVVAGWVNSRRRVRPVLLTLDYAASRGLTQSSHLPRHWQYLRGPAGQKPARIQDVPRTIASEALRQIATEAVQTNDVKSLQDRLILGIRDFAEQLPTVGADCMVVTIPHPRNRVISIRYCPKTLAIESFDTPSGTQDGSLGFGPWIVGPQVSVPPSLLVGTGSWQYPFAGFRFEYESPQLPPSLNDGSVLEFLQGQARPDPA